MSRRRFRVLGLMAAAALAAMSVLLPQVNAGAVAYATLNGSGSSWAGPAIDQWSRDIRQQGIKINYEANGSAAGRTDFSTGIKDFAGSDIAFLKGQDKIEGGETEQVQWGYSYVPITAGGTAFMYHLTVAGQQVRNLRLSGDTLTKIFTGQITNWSNPQITKDYGAQLPSEPIVPVIRADGSGASSQFTAWMNERYSSQWNAFCKKYGGVSSTPCGETEYFPSFPGAKSEGGSDLVANYISSSAGEGTIGYDEYAYAKALNYPVVKVLNPAGYYTLPTASNVAVALTHAVIDNNPSSLTYLMQDLSNVYTNTDPRSYPLSSYSYLIVPRGKIGGTPPPPPSFTNTKGDTLKTWANYFLCGGQQEMPGLGYSSLPINLVRGGFDQVDKIPGTGAVKTPNRNTLGNCNNPTFKNGVNTLLTNAPQPSPCDKLGAPLACGGGTAPQGPGLQNNNNPHPNNNNNNQSASNNHNSTNGPGAPSSGSTSTNGPNGPGSTVSNNSGGNQNAPTGGNRAASNSPTTRSTNGVAVSANTSGGDSGGGAVDPVTGQTQGASNNGPVGLAAQAVNVPAHHNNSLFGTFTALELVGAVALPPIIATIVARRRRRTS